MRRDQASEIKLVSSIAPQAAITATTTGAVVDTRGYSSVTGIVHFGVQPDGTLTPKLQEGELANGSDMADVAAADLVQNGFVAVTTANDDAIYECGYIGRKRYVRLVVTEDVATAGAFFTGQILLGRADKTPA
jgi:hypothetical protein